MGSWNGTCGITGLPIKWDTRVRWTVLKKSTYDMVDSPSGFCHPTGLWSPICGLGYGRYDDYGGIEFQQFGPVERFTMQWLADRVKKPWTEDMSLREILQNEREDDAATEADVDPKKKERPPQYVIWMADEDAINALEKIYPNPHGAAVETACLARDKGATLRAADGLSKRSDVNLRNAMMDMEFAITDVTDPDLFRALMCAYAEIIWLDTTMKHLRRMWAPQVGAGSQTEDWEEHIALAAVTQDICKAVLARYAEEDGEEDDDDAVS